MRPVLPLSAVFAFCVASGAAVAQQRAVDIYRITDAGVGEKIGTVSLFDSEDGLALEVNVTGLPAGQRGFHVHEKGDCGPGMKDGKMVAGMAAGPHYDPEGHKSHQGPEGSGHKGDLPALTGDDQGVIKQTVAAPRLKFADVAGRSIVIHEGGDNYSDQPENGGGKGRIACGVIPK